MSRRARRDTPEADAVRAVAALLNLGPKSAAWLVAAGIRSRADLERLGAVGAYLKVKSCEPQASLNLLWALAGALAGTHFTKLPDGMRQSLLLEIDARQAASASGRRPTRGKTRG
jgi:hypothetical protein